MNSRRPRVSVGLPVYNGENFLREAIDSVLEQTFEDLELIISDNASTDLTEEICRGYAAKDKRMKYFRNKENMGASFNYKRVFGLASGEYFKWTAHDDVCKPEFLERCVEVLDADSEVVLCYTRTATVNSRGQVIKEWSARPDLNSVLPKKRFRDILLHRETFPIWGLIRTDILKETPLLGNYPAHDRPLLAELSLSGRFCEVPEFLFLDREHQQRSIRAYDPRKPHEAAVWYDPRITGKIIFPAWRLFAEYVVGINRSQLGWRGRIPCYMEMLGWLKRNRQELLRDLIVAGQHIYGIGPLLASAHNKYLESRWLHRTERAAKDIKSVIPTGDIFILADEDTFKNDFFSVWQTIPFLERDGKYWGPPSDDSTAIRELERLRLSGANFIVFGWPTFWWLDHFTEFHRYLRTRFSCALQNDHLVLFDLRSEGRAGV